LLDAVYEIASVGKPSVGVNYRINALYAFGNERIERFEMSVNAFRTVLLQIERDKALSNFEKDYVTYYCKIGLTLCAERMRDSQLIREVKAMDVRFETLQPEKVRVKIRNWFPMNPPTLEGSSCEGGALGGIKPMKKDPAKAQGRVTEARYRALPDGHKTTLVAGMSDMLDHMAKYLDPKALAALEPVLEYDRSLISADLRKTFDSYLEGELPCAECAIVSRFFSMLIKNSGESQKFPN